LRSRTTIGSVFKSKEKRFGTIEVNTTPGVGQYHWDIVRQKVSSLKFGGSGGKGIMAEERSYHQKYYDKIMGNNVGDSAKEIGPGKYDPAPMDSHRAFSIRSDNRNRFGETARAY
jgi:hypothetical protein